MADTEQKGRPLTEDETKEMKMGFDLEEMTRTAGWKTVSTWLEDRAHHTWMDPRGMEKAEWEWAELNAFHSADVAKQMIIDVQDLVTRAHYLHSVNIGEVKEYKKMKL